MTRPWWFTKRWLWVPFFLVALVVRKIERACELYINWFCKKTGTMHWEI